MSIWIIEPREPLIFRDGRPFSSNPGAQASSLPFPFPSTTTGGARMQAGVDEQGRFTRTSEEVLQLKIRGPLLVRLPAYDAEHEDLEWLLPAPADALLLKPGTGEESTVKAEIRRLVPLSVGDDLTDLGDLSRKELFDTPLLIVGTPQPATGKPIPKSQAPAYWKWTTLVEWLQHPPLEQKLHGWDNLGIHGPQSEQRIHITFDGDRHMARDEALFETNGREFLARSAEPGNPLDVRRLALAVIAGDDDAGEKVNDLPDDINIRAGFATLGGERRIVRWRPFAGSLPECPPDLVKQVAKDGACRIMLLTPAYFAHGCYPVPESPQLVSYGAKPELRALAIDRPQVVSGWELAYKSNNGRSQGQPKLTRRLAPAGSVLFLKLHGTPEAIKQWVQAIWLHCISDHEQDCNDGFGLAVVGTWNGTPQEMKEAKP